MDLSILIAMCLVGFGVCLCVRLVSCSSGVVCDTRKPAATTSSIEMQQHGATSVINPSRGDVIWVDHTCKCPEYCMLLNEMNAIRCVRVQSFVIRSLRLLVRMAGLLL